MGWTTDLLTGLATHLHDSGAGTWRATGAYLPFDRRPIVLGSVPGSPDRVIVLSPYGVSDAAGPTDTVQGVQVRTRGAQGLGSPDCDDIADDVFDALHGLQGVVLNGVPVVLLRRTSWTPLGADGNRRAERSDNFYLHTNRSSPHRFD